MSLKQTVLITETKGDANIFSIALSVESKGSKYFESKNYLISWLLDDKKRSSKKQAGSSDYDGISKSPVTDYPTVSIRRVQIFKEILKHEGIDFIVYAIRRNNKAESIVKDMLSVCNRNLIPTLDMWIEDELTCANVVELMVKLDANNACEKAILATSVRRSVDNKLGSNISHCFGKLLNKSVKVGRVKTPLLALIVDKVQDRGRSQAFNFTRTLAEFEYQGSVWKGFVYKSKPLDVPPGPYSDAVSFTEELKIQEPPLLYNLHDLQGHAADLLGLTPKETYDILIYLANYMKYISYPVTELRVISKDHFLTAQESIRKIAEFYSDLFEGIELESITESRKALFEQVNSFQEHGIIPLKILPDNATPISRRIYDMIVRRFAAAMSGPYRFKQLKYDIEAGSQSFRCTSRDTISKGWRRLYPLSDKPVLPAWHPGLRFAIKRIWTEKRSTPQTPFCSTRHFLRGASSFGTGSDSMMNFIDEDKIALGSITVRGQTIDNLVNDGYVEWRKRRLFPTQLAFELIGAMRRYRFSSAFLEPAFHARLRQEFKAIELGMEEPVYLQEEVIEFVEMTLSEVSGPDPEASGEYQKPETVGECPYCNNPVLDMGFLGFACSDFQSRPNNCPFIISRRLYSRLWHRSEIRTILSTGEVGPLTGFIDKEGRPFTANFRLELGLLRMKKIEEVTV